MMFLAAAFVTSCSDDDSLASRGLETVEMPISISIPAEGFVNPTDVGIGNEEPASTLAVTRALGDPGTYEQFHLPQYIYLFLCNESTNGTKSVIYQKIEIPDNELTSSWEKTVSGTDSIYTYKGNVSINLPLNRRNGKIYAAASYKPLHTTNASSLENSNHLSFNCERPSEFGDSNPREYINESKTYTGTYGTEDAVKNIIFSNITLRNNMQDVYSTPYNKTDDKGDYYGTITDYASNVPNINIVLYHVATKVDLQWTIDEQFQGTKPWEQKEKESNSSDDTMRSTKDNTSEDYNKVFFSFIEARLLPMEKLPIFKPMNVKSSSGSFDAAFLGEEKDTGNSQSYTDANGKDKTRKEYYQVLPETEKSGMYYGRKVIYVMPKLVTLSSGDYYYDITLKILVNNYTTSEKKEDGTYTSLLTAEDHATTGHHAQIKIMKSALNKVPKDIEGYPIFTPWIRATIHVNSETDVENIVKFTNPVQ